MADTKDGRERQARDEENRQLIRAVQADLERGDEPEPEPAPQDVLAEEDYPVSGETLREEYAEYEVETAEGTVPLERLLEPAEGEAFDSAEAVRERLRELSATAASESESTSPSESASDTR